MLDKNTIFHFGREKSAFLLREKRMVFQTSTSPEAASDQAIEATETSDADTVDRTNALKEQIEAQKERIKLLEKNGIDPSICIASYNNKKNDYIKKETDISNWYDSNGTLSTQKAALVLADILPYKFAEGSAFKSTTGAGEPRKIDRDVFLEKLKNEDETAKSITRAIYEQINQSELTTQSLEAEWGFDVSNCIRSYILKKDDFKKRGISTADWFDEEGTLKQSNAATVLDEILPPTGKLQGTEITKKEFINQLKNNVPDAINRVKKLQALIQKSEMDFLKSDVEDKRNEEAIDQNVVDQTIDGFVDMIKSGDMKEKAAAGLILFMLFKNLKNKFVQAALVGLAGHTAAKSIFGIDVLDELKLTSETAKFDGTVWQAWTKALCEKSKDLRGMEKLASENQGKMCEAQMQMRNVRINELIKWYDRVNDPNQKGTDNLIRPPSGIDLYEIDEKDENKAGQILFGTLSLTFGKIAERNGLENNTEKGRQFCIAKYTNEDINFDDTKGSFQKIRENNTEDFENKKPYSFAEIIKFEIESSDIDRAKAPDTIGEKAWATARELVMTNKDKLFEDAAWGTYEITRFAKDFYEKWQEEAVPFIKDLAEKTKIKIKDYKDDVITFANQDGGIVEVGSGLLKFAYSAVGVPANLLWELIKFTAYLGENKSLEKGAKELEAQIKLLWQEWLGISNLNKSLQGLTDNETSSQRGPNIEWLEKNNDTVWQDSYFGQYADKVAKAMFSAENMELDGNSNAYFSIGKAEMNPSEFQNDPTQTDASMKLIWQERALEQAKENLTKNIKSPNQPFTDWEDSLDDCIITSFRQDESGKQYVCVALRVPTDAQKQDESETAREMKTFDYTWKKEWEKFGEKKVNITKEIEANNGDILRAGSLKISKLLNFLESHSVEFLWIFDKDPEQNYQDYSEKIIYYEKAAKKDHSFFFNDPQKQIEVLFQESFTQDFIGQYLKTTNQGKVAITQ